MVNEEKKQQLVDYQISPDIVFRESFRCGSFEAEQPKRYMKVPPPPPGGKECKRVRNSLIIHQVETKGNHNHGGSLDTWS